MQALEIGEPRLATPLTSKLARRVKLSPEDEAILRDLQSATQVVPCNRQVITAGEECNALLIVISGALIRYRIQRDGRRRILNLTIPGDFAGLLGTLFENAPFSTRTLTRSTLAVVPFGLLRSLVDTHPHFTTKLLWSFSEESASYAERLIASGCTSPVGRVAYCLLELLTRLQVVGLADQSSFQIPLTQRVIADLLGLGPGCVNRVLRKLRAENLVLLEEGRVVIKDLKELSALAGLDFPHHLPRFSVDKVLAPAQTASTATFSPDGLSLMRPLSAPTQAA